MGITLKHENTTHTTKKGKPEQKDCAAPWRIKRNYRTHVISCLFSWGSIA